MAKNICSYNRQFPQFLVDENITIVVSSYKSNVLLNIGYYYDKVDHFLTSAPRAMGLGKHKNKLYVASCGQLTVYKSSGKIGHDTDYGDLSDEYYPQFAFYGGDVDIHDVRVTDNGIFYISSLYNAIVQPSVENTFSIYWSPPWISKPLKAEDKCHLNGLCCVDGLPKYVTISSKGDTLGHWRSHTSEGLVYDVQENKVVCENIWSPHSPNWYDGKLWILESGTGQFGYIDMEKSKFVAKVFLPGFLRGLTFHRHYAIICLSLDRHDSAFGDLPLRDQLTDRNEKAHCGIRVVDMNDFSILYELSYLPHLQLTELYDVVCIPGSSSVVINQQSDKSLRYFDVDPDAKPNYPFNFGEEPIPQKRTAIIEKLDKSQTMNVGLLKKVMDNEDDDDDEDDPYFVKSKKVEDVSDDINDLLSPSTF